MASRITWVAAAALGVWLSVFAGGCASAPPACARVCGVQAEWHGKTLKGSCVCRLKG